MKNKIVSSDPAKYPGSFKHVERNVRSQALLIKAEEREDFNIHDLYQDRFKAKVEDSNHSNHSNHSEEGEPIEEESDVENDSKKEKETILAPQRLNL